MTTFRSENWLYGAVLSMSVLLAACIAPSETGSIDMESETDDTDSTSQALQLLGSVTQEYKIDDGWWMVSSASVRDDGVIEGSTELRNSRSLFGFHGETTVVLVDVNKNPLKYVHIGTWGIGACKWNCPRTRYESWSVQVDDWASIGSAVRGAAIVHRHDPQNTFWKWLEEHVNEVIDAAKKVAVLF